MAEKSKVQDKPKSSSILDAWFVLFALGAVLGGVGLAGVSRSSTTFDAVLCGVLAAWGISVASGVVTATLTKLIMRS